MQSEIMKQVLRRGLGEMVVEEVPTPDTAPHHVLIQTGASLISSGTETADIHPSVVKSVAENPGHLKTLVDVARAAGPIRTASEVMGKFKDLAALGYAGAGTLVEVHPSVTGLSVGQRVAYGGEGTGHAEFITTGQNLVATIPDGVSFEEAAFTTLGSIALNAVRAAKIEVGSSVLVLGLGIVGQLVAQLARVAGARVYAADLLSDRVVRAESLAEAIGIRGPSVPDEVLTLTDGVGVDCVIIAAAAKTDAPARIALKAVRDRGRIVIVGAVDISFPWSEMYMKEIQVQMARAYGPGSYDPEYERKGRDYPLPYVRWTEQRNMQEFLRLIQAKQVQVKPLISHRFGLEEAPKAYATVMESNASMGVVLSYPTQTDPAPPPVRRLVVRPPEAKSGLIKVALIGAGNIARWAHLPSLRSKRGATLHAVCSKGGVRAKSYATRFGASYCTTDLDEVLGDPDIDAVIIASRNQHHAPQAAAALRAGKHVFVEKPLALTEGECAELLQVEAESDRILMVGFNRRFAPSYLALKANMNRRAGPFVLNCRVNSPGISGGYWMADPAIGGAILGEACHFTDLMYWLLDSEPSSVHAFSLDQSRSEPIGQNNLTASFRFENGAIANLTYSTIGSTTSAGERLEVFMPGQGLIAEDFKYHETRGSVRRKKSNVFPKKGYKAQMAHFIEAIKTGKRAEIGGIEDGVRATVACLRMLESASTGEPQAIDWTALRG